MDERVEQLFEVMNAVMAASPGCRRARLTNKTYQARAFEICLRLLHTLLGSLV